MGTSDGYSDRGQALMRFVMIGVLVLLVLPIRAEAQTLRSDRVDLHGFGGWSYGQTDVNRFLGADTLGSYAKANFALNIGAAVHPTIQISAQLSWRNAYDGAETNLDYAFAQWQIADAIGLRAGKVKQPIGIYSELAGIGTVRPFLNLPTSVYGPVGLISRSYRGLGVRGSAMLGSGWSAGFDIYGGGIEFEQEESLLEWLANPIVDTVADFGGDILSSRDIAGARLILSTPVVGLSVGLSGYSGINNGIDRAERYNVLGGQLEYLADRIWFRSEILRQGRRFGRFDDRIVASYVEVAAFVTDKVQPALQYNRLTLDFNTSGLPSESYDDLNHSEWAFGLNYWVQPELGFKASLHQVEGNVVSTLGPTDLVQLFITGKSPQRNTRLLQLGVQFSF